MRLLLDAMFPAAVAEQLRVAGHDVVAAVERHELREAPDPTLFLAAQEDGRAVVTENIRDFVPLAVARDATDEPHHGLILTSNVSLPRHRRSQFIGEAVRRLAALLADHPADTATSTVHWL